MAIMMMMIMMMISPSSIATNTTSLSFDPRCFEVLLEVRKAFAGEELTDVVKKSAKLYSLFDMDSNRLVDCYEVMAAMAMIAHTSIKEKVDFVHSLYDFNGTGELTYDELVLLLRTVVLGCQKIDPRVEVPGTLDFESLATVAFTSLGRDLDKEITKYELDRFCRAEPRVREFLEFFSGTLNEVPLSKGEMFCDPDFPPDPSSLFTRYDHTPVGMSPASAVTWLRPHEFIRSTPVLLSPQTLPDGYLLPGQLSDLYFLKALGMLLTRPSMVRKLFLHTRQEAHGRYCVQFFKEGNWVPVYIDDRVPCNLLSKPAYSSFSDVNDIWVLLAEKAYAKLHGSYEALSNPAGNVVDALRDLTGVPTQRISLRENECRVKFESGDLWATIQEWSSQGLLGCMATDRTRSMPARQGIVLGDVYSVLQTVEKRGLRLLQLKNTFGRGGLQGTPWDADSESWNAYMDVHEELKLDQLPDHVFWIEYSSFLTLFDNVTVCWILDPPVWKVARRFSDWVVRGGGCFNGTTWPQTQQVFLKVAEGCNVIVNLTQQDPRYHGSQLAPIGLAVLQHDYDEPAVAAGLVTANLKRWRKVQVKCMTTTLHLHRDVFLRVFLPKGKYTVVAMTARPDQADGTFWLSLYYDKAGIKISQGGQCRDEEEMAEMSSNVASDLDQEMVESSEVAGVIVDEEDSVAVGLRAMAVVVDELWRTAKELQQRKMVLEEALLGGGVGKVVSGGVWRGAGGRAAIKQKKGGGHE